MTDKATPASSDPKVPPLHPAYSLTNILHKVRLLDGVKLTYPSWVKLFQLNAISYDVLHHIDGTPPPAPDSTEYASWKKIDAIVLQWIYGTLSDELLARVLELKTTAQKAWEKLEAIFLNNKGSRAAALDYELSHLTLKAFPSLEAYCQRLKELADQLDAVDCAVSEQRRVILLVRGLPPEYDGVASYLNQTR